MERPTFETTNPRILGEALTFDDVLIKPGLSEVLPAEVDIRSRVTRSISINIPIIASAMDTVTEAQMAIAMARGVRRLTGTDYGISVTGVAGPTGGRSGLPIGTFYLGLAGPDDLEVAERFHADAGDRDGNKRQAAQAVLDLLGQHLALAG